MFCNIQNISTDFEGRVVCCEISMDSQETPVTICAIYGPNNDTATFYDALEQRLADYCEQKIILGDFNLVMDPSIDRYGDNNQNNNWKAKRQLDLMIETYILSDVWRTRNENCLRFSWSRKNPRFIASRLDFALISTGLDAMVENCCYLQSILTDHSAFYLSINITKSKRGAGYWKLNTSLLEQEHLINNIRSRLLALSDETQDMDKIARWTYIKAKITQHLKELSRTTAQEEKLIISQLCEKVGDYEQNMPLNEHDLDMYYRSKGELDELSLKRAKSIMFRSKVKWVEDGEKNTKYFLTLEKSKYNARTCRKLLTEDDQIIEEEGKILSEQECYYRTLYKKNNEVEFNIQNTHRVEITDEQKLQCDEKISLNELSIAVKSMKNGKTPGEDGLQIEFYKMFWTEIGCIFHDFVSKSYEESYLPPSVISGILNLIPKPGKDSRLLKNLRPITLLNSDYKIIEKVIANRLDKTLNTVIHSDQTGFMKNRRISANIRKVLDLMTYCEERQINAVLINLDYAKCFDKIAFDCVLGSLKYFGYPCYIVNWIRILYSSFTIKVQNNGHFSKSINVERSVHQGGCASVQLFLLCAEIIALELRGDEQIQGIPVEEIIHLINQYADDTNIASLYEQLSVTAIFEKLKWFYYNSGFSLNYDKTEILRLGAMKGTDAKLYTQHEINWTNEPIKVLGIDVSHDNSVLMDNYTKLIDRTASTLKSWSNRNISLIGKITIVNSLVASLFVYSMQVLPSMSEETFKKIEDLIIQFVWSGRKAKISLKMLQLDKKHGGLNLVNLRERDKAVKITWVKLLTEQEKLASLVYSFFPKGIGHDIWRCNIHENDVEQVISKKRHPFWYDVLRAWASQNYDVCREKTFLWFNSNFKVNNKLVWWPELLFCWFTLC